MEIIALLLWIAYSVFEGMREARYWHVKIDYKGFRVFKEHMYWTFQRGIVLIMICLHLLSDGLRGIIGYPTRHGS